MAVIARKSLLTLLIAISAVSTNAFSINGVATQRRASTSLNMVFGPKQALAIEKRKNPQGFESTIQTLMKTNNLSRPDAEKVSVP